MYLNMSNLAKKILKIVIPLVLIPIAVLIGIILPGERTYVYISLCIAVLSLLLFAVGFEKKRTGTRRLMIVAVMVAMSVIGRFIPFFKPITALTVITAIYLGGESGFLVGSLSAFVSDFFFVLGPWTPFQMFAWGMIGLIAGILSPMLKKNRFLLLLYGVVSGVLFSFIMDIWTVLWVNGRLDLNLYLAAIKTAVPFTVLYAVSNIIFLAIFAGPIGQKLERIKIKYGV